MVVTLGLQKLKEDGHKCADSLGYMEGFCAVKKKNQRETMWREENKKNTQTNQPKQTASTPGNIYFILLLFQLVAF